MSNRKNSSALAEQAGCLGQILRIFGLTPDTAGGRTSGGGPPPYKANQYFFSKAERSFYGVLQHAIGEKATIFAKVRLPDLIYIPKGTANRQSWWNRIDRKHVDFVLCHPDTLKPLLVIELDDRSHQRQDRQERDAFIDQAFESAGLPILHVKAQQAYNVQKLRQQISAVLKQ